jgi:sulfate transport system ATP-binding protein
VSGTAEAPGSILVAGVTRRFGPGVAALDQVDLSIAPGEFVALLGPSGSGKTTLLRILAGLEFADAGTVALGSRDMAGVPARERNIGFVFQSYALFRHMRVADNVAFGLRVRPRRLRPPAAEIRERVAQLLALVQLPELADRWPEQFSGGQRQRVALARALATEPRLLLLDEPFGALDARVRKDLRHWLRRLHDRLGVTTVFVTHDQDEAMELSDRIAGMRAGRIVQCAPPAELLARPADAFVAGFLGEAMSLPCRVQDGLAAIEGFDPVPAAVPPGPAIAVRRPLPGEGANGTIRTLRSQGAVVRLGLEVGGLALEAEVPDGDGFLRGEAVRVHIRTLRHVFPQLDIGSEAEPPPGPGCRPDRDPGDGGLRPRRPLGAGLTPG